MTSFFRPARLERPTYTRIDTDAALLSDQVAFTRGPGTYHARLWLKYLGGQWKPDLLGGVWVVSVEVADEAEQLIQLAGLRKEDLPLDDQVKASIPTPAMLRCFMCGVEYPLPTFRTRKGARPEDYYCGCCETPGPPPRRQSRR